MDVEELWVVRETKDNDDMLVRSHRYERVVPSHHLPSATAMPPICTIRYFVGAVQGCADGFSGITLQHRF